MDYAIGIALAVALAWWAVLVGRHALTPEPWQPGT